jgi:hypothetical protein
MAALGECESSPNNALRDYDQSNTSFLFTYWQSVHLLISTTHVVLLANLTAVDDLVPFPVRYCPSRRLHPFPPLPPREDMTNR